MKVNRSRLKVILCVFLIVLFAFSASGCAQVGQPETEEEKTQLVLAVTEYSPGLYAAVDRFNESAASAEVNIVKYDTWSQLTDALEQGTADMYSCYVSGSLSTSTANDILNLSYDITDKFADADIELMDGLTEAFVYDGSLYCLPYDMELYCMAAYLPEVPSTVSEAQAAAERSGISLFPMFWDSENLYGMLEPYIVSAYSDVEAKEDILDAVIEHQGKCDSDYMGLGCLYWQLCIRNEPGYGISGYEYFKESRGIEHSIGLPGADSLAVYMPRHVIGISAACRDADAAWDVCELLFSDEGQSCADCIPVTKSAVDNYLEESEDSGKGSSYETAFVRSLIDESSSAVGLNVLNSDGYMYVLRNM